MTTGRFYKDRLWEKIMTENEEKSFAEEVAALDEQAESNDTSIQDGYAETLGVLGVTEAALADAGLTENAAGARVFNPAPVAEEVPELSRNEKAIVLLSRLASCLVELQAVGRSSNDHINAVNSLKQAIKSIENDNRL